MQLPDHSKKGWLVVDEKARITFSGGEIPELMFTEDGRLPELALETELGGLSASDVLSSICQGRHDQLEGQFASSDPQLTWAWSARSLRGPGDVRAVLLQIEPVPMAIAREPSDESGCGAFHSSPVGMFRIALSGQYIEVNAALAELYGFQSQGGLLRHLNDVSGQVYLERRRRLDFVEAMRLQGVVQDFQSEVARADGSVIWTVEFARTVEDPEGRPLYYEGTVLDISAFKAAERELHSSREQFRRLVECVNVVPWEAEASTGRLRYVGPQAQELLNFPLGDWFEPGFWSHRLHPADRDWVEIVRDDAVQTHGRFESEYRMLNARDEVVWVRDIASVIQTANGERILGGFLHNITYRRAAEEALRTNQDFIEQIANASPLIWYVLDLESNQISYLNGGGIRMLGFSRADLLKMGKNFFLALADPEETAGYHKHFERLKGIRKGEYVEREFRLRAASNGSVWVRTHETALKVSRSGRVHQVVGVAEDITIQRAALENLANSEALFRRLAETTRVIPFELDLANIRFTYIGPQAAEQLGIESKDWLSCGFWGTVVHPDDRSMVEKRLLSVFRGPDGHEEMELRLRDNSGEYHWFRQVLRSEADDEGRVIGRGYFLNISASKLIEHEREESRRQLRELDMQNQRLREEERLAMSREIHDELGQALTLLRFDLTWIGSRLSKLLPPGTGEPVNGKIQEMDADIGKTLQIVRRITTQLRPPLLDEFGLADAIEWQVKEFSRRAGIRCEVSAKPVGPNCKDTPSVVFRIFQELLTNVARHSKASRVRVLLNEADGVIYLSVSDNGCGFDPKGKRTGFGLLGMRERTEMLRGKLRIESAIGRGTTVTLSVPIESRPDGPKPSRR